MILLPNGIPPERLFTKDGLHPEGISLVLLGAKDDPSLWETYPIEAASAANFSVDEDGVIRQEMNY